MPYNKSQQNDVKCCAFPFMCLTFARNVTIDPRIVKVYNLDVLLTESFPLSNGNTFFIEHVEKPNIYQVSAILRDDELGLSALVVYAETNYNSVVKRMRLLGVDAELSNTIVETIDGKQYRIVVIPTARGKSVFSYKCKALTLRAVSEFISRGINPMGTHDTRNIAEAMCNLIHNLIYAIKYNFEDDCFAFSTPGVTIPLKTTASDTIWSMVTHLVEQMFD